MNSFIDTLLDFYHRCGTILWKATVEGRVFCKKKLFLQNTLQWLLPGVSSEHCQKSKIECFAKINNA